MRSEGYGTWSVRLSVCLSVSLSVTTFSATTRNKTTKERRKRGVTQQNRHTLTFCSFTLCGVITSCLLNMTFGGKIRVRQLICLSCVFTVKNLISCSEISVEEKGCNTAKQI